MIGQMAIAIALPGFNDLVRLVTPIFLLMVYFLYRFSTLSEKMKIIYRLEAWFFLAKCGLRGRRPKWLERGKTSAWSVRRSDVGGSRSPSCTHFDFPPFLRPPSQARQNAPSNSIIYSSSFICAAVSNASCISTVQYFISPNSHCICYKHGF